MRRRTRAHERARPARPGEEEAEPNEPAKPEAKPTTAHRPRRGPGTGSPPRAVGRRCTRVLVGLGGPRRVRGGRLAAVGRAAPASSGLLVIMPPPGYWLGKKGERPTAAWALPLPPTSSSRAPLERYRASLLLSSPPFLFVSSLPHHLFVGTPRPRENQNSIVACCFRAGSSAACLGRPFD